MKEQLNLAVVGTGVMGANHARTINKIDGANLAMVVDKNLDRANHIAAQYDCKASDSLDDIYQEDIDGAIVAAPSPFHFEISNKLLDNGVDLLVEKPLGLNSEETVQIDEKAKELGRVLMVGHIELFNPTVRELQKIIGSADVRSLRFNRLGSVQDEARLQHDVVFDLMIHDVAVASRLLDRKKEDIAVISSTGREDTKASPDPVEANLDFSNGQDVHLRASRAYTGGKVRTITVEAEDSVIEADLVAHNIIQKKAGEGRFSLGEGVFEQDVKTAVCLSQSNEEPLVLETEHFLNCIKGVKRPEDEYVSGEDGIMAVAIARQILDKLVIVR